MQKLFIALTFAVFVSFFAFAQPLDTLVPIRNLIISGKNQEAIKKLADVFNIEKRPDNKSKEALALGLLYFKEGQREKAVQFLSRALELKTKLDDYAEFYIGMIERDNKDLKGAKVHFEAVKNHHPRSVKAPEAEKELAHIARLQEKWREAYSLLFYQERRYRRDAEYPNMLSDLVDTAMALKRKSDACRYAIKVYSKYPTLPIAKSWGFDLSQAKVRGMTLGCQVTTRDRERRFDNLLLAGEFDRSREELKAWLSRINADRQAHPKDLGKMEQLQGQLALAEGKVKDAITHLLLAKDILGPDFSTQMLLAKAYSQTDDYARAVEGYMRAYEIKPRSKLGQKALFQAAFLSYQNRDYDGASKRFEDVVKKIRGRVAWDARWHLAWIRYLKADYEGALQAFGDLTKDKKYAKSVDLEKLTYWRSMASLRLGQIEPARAGFLSLAQSKRLGYYAGAAEARLQTFTQVPVAPAAPAAASPGSPALLPAPAVATSSPSPTVQGANAANATPSVAGTTAAQSGSTPAPSAANNATPTPTLKGGVMRALPSSASLVGLFSQQRKPASVESGDDDLGGGKDSEIEDEKPAEETTEEALTPEEILEAPPISSLKNPALLDRFERARDLLDLGFDNLARAELREIEKRTSNHGYLQNLMIEYLKAGDYYRSAYIADVVFEAAREKDGIEGAALLWAYAFPQAYLKLVQSAAKKFDVPQALVWAIMRGESGFREEIHSSAGAMGLMQLIPPTAKRIAEDLGAKDFKIAALLSPETNIQFGTRYLKRLNKTMANNLPLTIASYNAGPHRVQGWLIDFGNLDLDEFIEHIPYMETRNYVKKVLRNYLVYQTLYEKKSNVLSWLAQKPSVKFEGPKPLAENWDN